MATTNSEFLIHPFQAHLILASRNQVHTFQESSSHQRIAVYAYKHLTEFGFQLLQGFIDKHLALTIAYRHIFLIRQEVTHIIQRN